jgi:RimJ/RimL family protein N-acetyltransferase
MTEPRTILTQRLRLRTWTDTDRDSLAQMMADPEVMHDYGGPVDRSGSDAKLDEFAAGFVRDGYSRWLVEADGEFVGYVGIAAHADDDHPLGAHSDLGWRLSRHAWGKGYATEAARAALADVFVRTDVSDVVAYTSADNVRSQAVMDRLGLLRDESRDFVVEYPVVGEWTGLVWSASAHQYVP